ncbi:hypothetical protein L0668_08205 [Paraglaciecola aquimarina]|uniref:Uncharacterized protein n=1 Tax=Paraglaciecola algarum TaxID=3050085 RepID=A0ABS9D5M7_9ALTE|nr:hypothetical protein [Paraglaciecola sp. G1-23]MCF2948085.1 hypothetical protein [Paraglaciecola sp. G1-23]
MSVKNRIALLTLGAASFGSLADPFGEKVNCREEAKGQQNMYAGEATCSAQLVYVNHSKSSPTANLCMETEIVEKWIPISEDVAESSNPVVAIGKLHHYKTKGITTTMSDGVCTILNESDWITCAAEVPFSHVADVYGEVCDYKPVSSTSYYGERIGINEYITSIGTTGAADFDGHIVSRELWINGVEYDFNTIQKFTTQSGAQFAVRIRVTDNDGYQTEDTQTIRAIDSSNHDPSRPRDVR